MNNPHLMPHSGFQVYERRYILNKHQVVVDGNKIYVENMYHFVFSFRFNTDFQELLDLCVNHANRRLKEELELHADGCIKMIKDNSEKRIYSKMMLRKREQQYPIGKKCSLSKQFYADISKSFI